MVFFSGRRSYPRGQEEADDLADFRPPDEGAKTWVFEKGKHGTQKNNLKSRKVDISTGFTI